MSRDLKCQADQLLANQSASRSFNVWFRKETNSKTEKNRCPNRKESWRGLRVVALNPTATTFRSFLYAIAGVQKRSMKNSFHFWFSQFLSSSHFLRRARKSQIAFPHANRHLPFFLRYLFPSFEDAIFWLSSFKPFFAIKLFKQFKPFFVPLSV